MDRHSARELIERLEGDARSIAAPFGLRFASLEAERANVTRRYGVCFSDGTIRIRLRHALTGRPLKYSSLVNTLCHELAHLRHFNHSKRFYAFYDRLLAHARRLGVYRPGRLEPLDERLRRRAAAPRRSASPGPAGPVQLSLFGTSGADGSAAL